MNRLPALALALPLAACSVVNGPVVAPVEPVAADPFGPLQAPEVDRPNLIEQYRLCRRVHGATLYGGGWRTAAPDAVACQRRTLEVLP
jgi:hypothetical protein